MIQAVMTNNEAIAVYVLEEWFVDLHKRYFLSGLKLLYEYSIEYASF